MDDADASRTSHGDIPSIAGFLEKVHKENGLFELCVELESLRRKVQKASEDLIKARVDSSAIEHSKGFHTVLHAAVLENIRQLQPDCISDEMLEKRILGALRMAGDAAWLRRLDSFFRAVCAPPWEWSACVPDRLAWED